MREASADGLRGFAALNVAIAHFVVAFWPELLRKNYAGLEQRYDALSLPERLLSLPPVTLAFNGHFAVLIFFVLSGYVLAAPSVDDDYQKLRGRAIARYARLNLPIAAATMIAWIVGLTGICDNHAAAIVSGSAWLDSFMTGPKGLGEFISSALFGGILGGTGFIPPLWTLEFEWWGSLLLLAALILAPPRRGPHTTVLASIVLVVSHPPGYLYLLCFFGGALINWLPRGNKGGTAMALLGASLGAYQPYSSLFGWMPVITEDPKTFYNICGAVLLVIAVCRRDAMNRLVTSAFAGFLGKVSYSLYLLHFVVLFTLPCYIVVNFGVSLPALALAFICYIPPCLLISYAFARTVDEFAIKAGAACAKFSLGGLSASVLSLNGDRPLSH